MVTTRRRSAAPSGHVEIRALGECSVAWITARGARQEVPSRAWRHGRARALFLLLLSRPNLQITRDAAIEALWPEATLAAGRAYLSNALWNLRAALAPPVSASASSPASAGQPSTQPASLIHATRSVIALRATTAFPPDASHCWLDVLAFESACAEMRRGEALEPRRRAAEAALALYRGHLLPETLGEMWADARRDHLRLSWIESAFHLAEISFATGQWHAALEPLLRVLDDSPDHVDAACAAMRVLARMGRPQDALSLHDRVRHACWRADEGYPEPLRRAAAAVRQGHLATSEMSGGRWPWARQRGESGAGNDA